jgi:MFS family permease
VHPSTSELDRTYRKVTARLIPFLFVCYLVSYLDRVNVGFAKLQMLNDLHFSEAIYGLGAGIFFIGYFIFEVPSNIILAKVGPRIWIGRIMITWGLISSAMMFVDSPGTYYVLRFLLGVAEAGFFPGIILYLTYWYPEERRGRIVALFMSAVAMSGIVGGPMSGWILGNFGGVHGLAGWQWLFLLEGIPAVVMGIATFAYLDDSIAKAKWLQASEKEQLQAALQPGTRSGELTGKSFWSLFASAKVWIYCGIYFSFVMGLYGVGFWLPNLLKVAGVKDVVQIGLWSAVPYVAAAVGMFVIGRSSDQRSERHGHLILPALIGAAGFGASALFPNDLPIALTGITLATVAILSCISLSWSLPTAYLPGTLAAAGIALINSIGNLAGFVSPYLVGWLKDLTGNLSIGLGVLCASMVAGAVLVAVERR